MTGPHLWYLNGSHLDRLQGKMSPWDSNNPLDKCSLSHHQRAWLLLPLLNSNTLKTRRYTNTDKCFTLVM